MDDLKVSIAYRAVNKTQTGELNATPAEFARFEKLTAALTNVPKTEVDKKRKKS